MKLFFSYSHKDETLRDSLSTHLTLLERQGIITTWYDRAISPGNEWSEEIHNHLDTAQIILLLISADFLASDYCYEIELQKALDRHKAKTARVIPIILRPCDWQTAPFGILAALPTAHSAGIKPVTKWENQDEAFAEIAKGIRKAAEEMKQFQHSPDSRIEVSLPPPPKPENTISQTIYIGQVGILQSGNVVVHGDQVGAEKNNPLTSFCGCVDWIYEKSNHVGLRGLDEPHRQILETALKKAHTDFMENSHLKGAELEVLELISHYIFYCYERRFSPKFEKMSRNDYRARVKLLVASKSSIRCGKVCLSSLIDASDPMSKLVARLEKAHESN